MKVQSEFDGEEREVSIVPGKSYVIEPLNPRKNKHRGRKGMLTMFEKTSGIPDRGWLFLYNATTSILVDLADLEEVQYPERYL